MKYDIRKMDQPVLECRDLGHAWKHEWTLTAGKNSVERLLACARCNTLRRDVLSLRGETEHRSYAYGAGYQVLGVHLNRPTVRAEAIRRALAEMDAATKKVRA